MLEKMLERSSRSTTMAEKLNLTRIIVDIRTLHKMILNVDILIKILYSMQNITNWSTI